MNRSLMPLAGLYGAGARLRRRAFQQGWLRSNHLSQPVISVGNLTVGGSGKTPLVAQIAEILLRNGLKPSILTRGYRRECGADLIALEPQTQRNPDCRVVGDEPALLARLLPHVPIVVCSDRYRAGQLAEEHYGVDVHILDDGFQHFALEREIDLVAIDVTQDVGQEALLPAGRLREPLSALSRADMMILTRVEIEAPDSIERQVRKFNSEAPIFHCAMELRSVIEASSQETIAIEQYNGKPICAFCAIGTPAAFFSDLRNWGFNPVTEIAFRDHHVYIPEDVQRLNKAAKEKGTVAFLTTEKDLMNLPPRFKFDLPVLVCAIQAKILDFVKFEKVLLAGIESNRVGSRVVPRT
jgi:tetraacyldisaccharide 4'-kinase